MPKDFRATDTISVKCKCPALNCGKIHIVKMGCRPLVMPRRYCEKHSHLRHDSSEGYQAVGSARGKYKKKKESA